MFPKYNFKEYNFKEYNNNGKVIMQKMKTYKRYRNGPIYEIYLNIFFILPKMESFYQNSTMFPSNVDVGIL